MKKRGFTMIELLAVIVVLAVISLIVVPVIINIINDSKAAADKRSVEHYLKMSQLSITTQNLKTPITDGACSVQENANLDCDGIIIEVAMKGSKPESGVVTIDKGKITSVVNLKLNNKFYNLGENGELLVSNKPVTNVCSYDEELKVGTEVICGTESFYVINNDDKDTVTLLAKYNLNVGWFYKDGISKKLEPDNPLQSSQATGIYTQDSIQGAMEFSDSLSREVVPPTEPACEYHDSCEYIIDMECEYGYSSYCMYPEEPIEPICSSDEYNDVDEYEDGDEYEDDYDSCQQEWEDYENEVASYNEKIEEYDTCISDYEQHCSDANEEYSNCTYCQQKWEEYEEQLKQFNNSDSMEFYGYWWNINKGDYKSKYKDGTQYPYVYDENSYLYEFVNKYGNHLNNIGLKIEEIRIPNGSEINKLPNVMIDARKTYIWDYIENSVDLNDAKSMTDEQIENYSNDFIKSYFDKFNYSKLDRAKVLMFALRLSSEEQNLLMSRLTIKTLTSYWLGNAIGSNKVAFINKNGEMDGGYISNWDFGTLSGIRPVIVVKRSEL